MTEPARLCRPPIMTMASTRNITLMLTDAGATKPTSPT